MGTFVLEGQTYEFIGRYLGSAPVKSVEREGGAQAVHDGVELLRLKLQKLQVGEGRL